MPTIVTVSEYEVDGKEELGTDNFSWLLMGWPMLQDSEVIQNVRETKGRLLSWLSEFKEVAIYIHQTESN